MDIVTNEWLKFADSWPNRAPSDYELSGNLAKLTPVGAGLLSWQGQRVSMVCLESNDKSPAFLLSSINPPLAVLRSRTPNMPGKQADDGELDAGSKVYNSGSAVIPKGCGSCWAGEDERLNHPGNVHPRSGS